MSIRIRSRLGRIGTATFLVLLSGAFSSSLWAIAPEGLLPKTEVRALVASAKSKADHMKLARHFQATALQMEAQAQEHQELVKEYRRNPTGDEQKHPGSARTASHCEYFAEHMAKAAREARLLAAGHERMAESAK
jgi:hypothetical protein